jgi:hypothetical protein
VILGGPYRESRYLVFISHSSRDSWIARMMAEKVSALGAEAWLDVKDLEGGDIITAFWRGLLPAQAGDPDPGRHRRGEIPPLIAQFRFVRYSDLRGYLSELEQRASSSAGDPPVAAAH